MLKVRLDSVSGETVSITVKLEEFQDKRWTKTTVKPLKWVDVGMPGVQLVEQTQGFQMALIKHSIMSGIIEAMGEQLGLGDIRIEAQGRYIVATAEIPKGKLCIAPVTTKFLMNSAKKSKKTLHHPYTQSAALLGVANIDGDTCFVSLGAIAASPAVDKTPGTFSPFWYFGIAHEQSECNCELSAMGKPTTKLPINGPIKIPVIKNTRKIKIGAKLVLWLPAGTTDEDGANASKKKAKK